MTIVYLQSDSSHIIVYLHFDAFWGENLSFNFIRNGINPVTALCKGKRFCSVNKIKIFLCLITTMNFKHKNVLPCFVRYHFSSNPLLFLFISVKAFLLNLHGIHCNFSACVHNFSTFSAVKPGIMFIWLREFL